MSQQEGFTMKKSSYFTKSDLTRRGWSNPLISFFLMDTGNNFCATANNDAIIYPKDIIYTIEHRSDFKDAKNALSKYSTIQLHKLFKEHGKEKTENILLMTSFADNFQNNIMNIEENITLNFQPLSEIAGHLPSETFDSIHRERQHHILHNKILVTQNHVNTTPFKNNLFLYIKHNLTSYNIELKKIEFIYRYLDFYDVLTFNDIDDGYISLNKAVNIKIKQHYPELSEQCDTDISNVNFLFENKDYWETKYYKKNETNYIEVVPKRFQTT